MLAKVAEHIMCQLSLPTGVDTTPISTVGLLRSSAELRHQASKKKKKKDHCSMLHCDRRGTVSWEGE